MKKTTLLFLSLLSTVHAAEKPFRLRCRPFKVHESYIKFERESGIRLREVVIEQPDSDEESPRVLFQEESKLGGFGRESEKVGVRYEGDLEHGFRAFWDRGARLLVSFAGLRGGRRADPVREYTGSLTVKPGSGFFVRCELEE
jgi:hypothetical protein